MLNKLKTAVNRYADYMGKKLDMVERAGSALCNGVKEAGSKIYNDIKHINGLKIGCMLVFIGGGCITSHIISKYI